jgi:hypothetical protein
MPASFTGGTLTAPFSFTGLFALTANPTLIGLTGSGTATLTFEPSSLFPGTFFLQAARYNFAAAETAPTPEPASMLLFVTGLAGSAAARRRLRMV